MPGAKFVELPGADHWPWIGHEEAVEEIQEFLTGMRDSTEPDRAIVTVMFVDIVDSTKRAAELGDRRWADLLESFYAVVRRELDRYRGREIDTAGDGFFVIVRRTSAAPSDARRHSRRLSASSDSRSAPASIPESASGSAEKVRGLGVVIGARVGALAAAGEILVSRTVQDLVVGSGLIFEDAGEHELKGVPDRWRLYRVVG